MTRPKRGAGPVKGSRGRQQQSRRNVPRGRDGSTRDSTPPARETPEERQARAEGRVPREPGARSANPARSGSGSGLRGEDFRFSRGNGNGRTPPPRPGSAQKKPLPELRRVTLDTPAPETPFRNLDGETHRFPDSGLKRVAAQILAERRKPWRYRPFAFPLFTERGHEQNFFFDFYIYDPEGSVIRLILVVPHESREVWDKVGRFKRQYPMYTYELWTPEKLGQFQAGGKLGW